jgi:hypothetical protein
MIVPLLGICVSEDETCSDDRFRISPEAVIRIVNSFCETLSGRPALRQML